MNALATLNQPWTIGGVLIRKVTVIEIVMLGCLFLLRLLLDRTSVGLHMRAASMDFATARLLGVCANRVIGGAVIISGIFAAIVAVLLTVTNPQVTPDFALHDTIVVLAGVVLGGLNRPLPATLGGFSIGFASGVRRRAPHESEPVPRHLRLCRGDLRAAHQARGALHASAWLGGAGMEGFHSISGATNSRPAAASRRFQASNPRRTICTFSSDIAYSESSSDIARIAAPSIGAI